MTREKYHFIGIGGIGMSALAQILLDKHLPVSGSDLSLNETTEKLKSKGAYVHKGHSEHHISEHDTVIFNSQIQKENPEYSAALQLKRPLLHRSELLAQLMRGYQTLAVSGTHGKTTTSSLLTNVLIEAGLDPTFALGGLLAGTNGRLGKGSYFVAEADESDGSFLNYTPSGAIVTNIEAEHLDYYKTESALEDAFRQFFAKVKHENLLFYCGDDEKLALLSNQKGVSYGFGAQNALKIERFKQKEWSIQFDLHFEGKTYSEITVSVIGTHNALNAAAVFGLSLRLGIPEEKIRLALKHFPGVARRAEKKGGTGGILFLDDYAHHPTEILTTIKAVKDAVKERRLVVVFQPHRYSRVKELFEDFCTSFDLADFLLVTDIYSAQEQPIEGLNGELLAENIQKFSTVPTSYAARENLCENLKIILRPHDVVLTLGAGDINRLHSELLKDFSPKKLNIGLIFGGRSCEHEISLRSSRFVGNSLNPDLYNVRYFGINKEGRWILGNEAEEQLRTESVIRSQNTFSILDPEVTQELALCDVFLPILHGTYGEDGTLQGFFEILDKPYTGPDWRAAAICMDKVMTKRLVAAGGVKTPKDLTFGYLSWLENKNDWLERIEKELSFPVYVKPVHLGSSVGISCVYEPSELGKAIHLAFSFDIQVLVEEGKMNCRELEFAVLGNTHSYAVVAPAPGEKLAEGNFVDYQKKYGNTPVKTTVTPDLPPELLEKGKRLAKLAYESVGSSGMTRVDFLLDTEGEFWLFEMNPIPGLQQFSLFPKIWNREGVVPEQLFDRLIILALERHERQKRHTKCLV